MGQIPQHKTFVWSLSEAIENATFWIGARCAKRNSKSVDLKKNKFACSKISSSTSAILFAAIFSLAESACHFVTSAVRNLCNNRLCDRLRSSAIIWKQLSLRSSAICDLRSAIVCDHMETSLKLTDLNALDTVAYRSLITFNKIRLKQNSLDREMLAFVVFDTLSFH